MDTSGATGAAIASGVATGAFSSLSGAMQSSEVVTFYEPEKNNDALNKAFADWVKHVSDIDPHFALTP